MRTLSFLALLGLVLLSAGCAGNAALIEAMAKDPASVCVTVTSVYGTVKVYRTAIAGGSVKCDGDGMTVTPAAK